MSLSTILPGPLTEEGDRIRTVAPVADMSIRVEIERGRGSLPGSTQLHVWAPSTPNSTPGSPAWSSARVQVVCGRRTPAKVAAERAVVALEPLWNEEAVRAALAEWHARGRTPHDW